MCLKQINLHFMNLTFMVHQAFSHYFLTWSSKQSSGVNKRKWKERDAGGREWIFTGHLLHVPNTIGMWIYSLVTFWQSWGVHVFIFIYIMRIRKISYLGLCPIGNNWQRWGWIPSLIPKRKCSSLYSINYRYWLKQFRDCGLPNILLLKTSFLLWSDKLLEVSFSSCF